MLDVFAALLKAGLELVFCITILRMFLIHDDRKELLTPLTVGILGGGVASLILFAVNKYVVRLEIGDLWVKGILVAAILLLLTWMHFAVRKGIKRGGAGVMLVTGFSLLIGLTDKIFVSIYPVLSLQNGFNSEWITQLGALVLALCLLFLMAYAFLRVVHRMSRILIIAAFLISFAQLFVYQLIELLQMLFGLQIIPLSMVVFDILMPLVNHKAVFFYGLLGIISLLLVFFFIQLRWLMPPEHTGFANPAEKRKLVARDRSVRRWFYSLSTVFVLVLASIVTDQVSAMRGIEEKPAIKVTPESDHIHLVKADLKEKELNVYSCPMHDGTEVRFIAVRKNGENFGVAMDACEICGVAGYYQKDGQIICKKCNSVVNVTTVGFKGGCNPIPIKYEQKEDGTIDIPVAELEKYKDRFK